MGAGLTAPCLTTVLYYYTIRQTAANPFTDTVKAEGGRPLRVPREVTDSHVLSRQPAPDNERVETRSKLEVHKYHAQSTKISCP